MSRTRRRPRKGPRFLFILIILGLLVFLGADNFGFNWFNFKVDLNDSSNTAKSTNSDDASKKASKNQYANIVIKDDQITFNESTIILDKLSGALDQLDKDAIIINLMDDGAYNTTFTDVEDLIKEKNMKYIVSTIKSQ